MLHLRLHHASMLKTFSLARMSPYTTSHKSRRNHRPPPPFTRIAIMYLWGQCSNLLSILPNDYFTRPCLNLRRDIYSLIYRIENAEFVLRKYIPSIGRQRESLKSAIFRKNSKIVFILLLFVADFSKNFAREFNALKWKPMKRRQKGKIAKNKFFSLIGSQRKHIKPDIPLIFNWELF